MIQKPCLFEYSDFRYYLRDFYTYKNALDKKFSKSHICKEMGLPNSRSYFQDVLNGKFVSNLKIPLFIKLLKLSKEETVFFRILVDYNQITDDPDKREFLFEQLLTFKKTPKLLISSLEYTYYKEWYHSVVRAVLNIIDFKKTDNYRYLARQIFPPLTQIQARNSVNLLLNLNLLQENENGFLKPTDKVISTGTFAKDDIVKQYQMKSLEIARKAIINNHKLPQRVITKMMSVSEDGYKRIEKQVEKFNAEITSIVHQDDSQADRVYQLDLVLFPHSKKGLK